MSVDIRLPTSNYDITTQIVTFIDVRYNGSKTTGHKIKIGILFLK